MFTTAPGQRRTLSRIGFTVVELLIVIVVIGILATLTIIAYSGVQGQARSAKAKDSATQAMAKIKEYTIRNGALPGSLSAAGVTDTGTVSYTYRQLGNAYCVAAATGGTTYQSLNGEAPLYGNCTDVSVQVYSSFTSNITMQHVGSTVLTEGTVPAGLTYNFGTSALISGGPTDNFIGELSGFINPPVTGTYTFSTVADDRDRLYIDNQLVVDGSLAGSTATTTGTKDLTANTRVAFRYIFQENTGGASYAVSWSYPGQTNTAVPASVINQ